MAELQYPALVEPLEPSLTTEPPLESWLRPTNEPLFRTLQKNRFLFVEPLEPSLFIEPPLESWLRETNAPLFKGRRHNLEGFIVKPLDPNGFVVTTVPDLIWIVDVLPPPKKRRHNIEGFVVNPFHPRLFLPSIADYLTAAVRLSGATYDFNFAYNNFQATRAPTIDDDAAAGYSPGSLWVDKTNQIGYQCIRATPGAALWKQIT